MVRILHIIVLLFSISFAYEVGETISLMHQNKELDICYASELDPNNDGIFSLAEYNGDLNGGQYFVTLIDMSATWCGPCLSLIPYFDNVASEWQGNENVKVVVALTDLNEPYSCLQWGNMGTNGTPMIADDTGYPLFNMLNTESSFPSSVFIDHTMTVYYKEAGVNTATYFSNANMRIAEMLDNLYGTLIMTANPEISLDNELDNDGILNPGEGFSVAFVFTNYSFEADALNAVATLTIDAGGNITTDAAINLGDIPLGETMYGDYSILLDDSVPFGEFNLNLTLTADFINNLGELDSYTKEVPFSIDVSLNQSGFPISTAEVKASPLVIDLDGDGDDEIIFGDNNGFVHIYNADGTEVEDDTFPYDTGNQIWGSAAAADLDNDGNLDFVIASKSKHLYIFDKNGLKTDYNANKYLMGTPAIGNLDDDDDLEIVIGGYSSSNQIFAINPDGSNVDGFPLALGEKTKAGVALADFNGNGKDDIVLGTDDDNIYLIYDDGTIAPGFPFTVGDKIQAAPAIQEIDGEKVIFSGSNDDSFYAIKSDGSLLFSVLTGDKVLTSPSFLEENGQLSIFFGSNDDMIYAVDSQGSSLPGWPIEVNGTIGGSVVFSDLDGDGQAEVLASTDMGEIVAFHLNGDAYPYFPIVNDFPFSGSPMTTDLDDDGDLEIITGSGSNLFVIDIKESGSNSNYWSMFRGNKLRSGTYMPGDDTSCGADLGDVTGDGNINILDLVQIANYILEVSTPLYECAADYTQDGNVNILDLVQIANYILDN